MVYAWGMYALRRSTTIGMRTVSIPTLERWIEGGKFNPNHKAEDEYSRSTGILFILNPNHQGTALKCMSVGLIVRQRNGNVGWIEDIPKLIAHAFSQLQESKSPQTFCIIVGDYGGSMGFATDPPFCTAYPLSFAIKDDPARMTFSESTESACLIQDRWFIGLPITRTRLFCARVSMENRNNRRLIIPQGLHFSIKLFPQIVIPCNHAALYHDPRTGMEAPFFTVGPFASLDMLFLSTAGDLDLFTDGEVYTLRMHWCIEISNSCHLQSPHINTCLLDGESTRKRSQRDSLRRRHPVSSAAGSAEDLGKSEYERFTEPKCITWGWTWHGSQAWHIG